LLAYPKGSLAESTNQDSSATNQTEHSLSKVETAARIKSIPRGLAIAPAEALNDRRNHFGC
jgi:hypothetical protein